MPVFAWPLACRGNLRQVAPLRRAERATLPKGSITAEYKTTLRLVFYDEAFFYLFFFVVTHARR